MFKTIRKKHPDIPIIMASRPNFYQEVQMAERIEVIKTTYNNAKKSGDENVYFINGQDMLNFIDRDIVTMEDCHPTDFGYYCMAKKFEEVLKKVL